MTKEKRTVVAIVQARMGSERFPGKVLQPILDDITMLELVCMRIRLCSGIDSVLVATSVNPADDAIVDLCKEKRIPVFRGSEEDVMDRVLSAANEIDCDIIVDVTADCPLVDPDIIDVVVGKLINEDLDYCSNVITRTFPDGMDVQAYTHEAFARMACNFPVQPEHTGINFIKFAEHFKLANVDVKDDRIPAVYSLAKPNWELTVDYPEDLDLVKLLLDLYEEKHVALCNYSYKISHDFETWLLIDWIVRHPALLKINGRLARKQASNPMADVVI